MCVRVADAFCIMKGINKLHAPFSIQILPHNRISFFYCNTIGAQVRIIQDFLPWGDHFD